MNLQKKIRPKTTSKSDWTFYNTKPISSKDVSTLEDIIKPTALDVDTSSSTITETVTTKKSFQLPQEIVTQIVNDSRKLFQFEIEKLQTQFDAISKEFADLRRTQRQSMLKEGEIENQVIEKNRSYLFENYKGQCVGITYDGKIIASSQSKLDVTNKIKESNVLLDQIFLYEVPLK